MTDIHENSFEGAPGGSAGTLNYSTGWGTPSGGNITQNPDKFSSSDKTTNHFEPNTESGSAVPRLPDRPDRVSKNVISMDKKSPSGNANDMQANKPLDPTKEFDPQVDQIFKKKQTPSPDEIMSALQYELNNMTKKDKVIAKQIVLKNLKQDPHYYSRLHMLNIDDKDMKVDESKKTTFDKTKSVLDEMIAARKKTSAIADTPELNQIFKDLYAKRRST